MENASVLFKRIMLGLLLALLVLTLALVVREGLQSHSYLLALAAGLVWALAAFLLLRKKPLRLRLAKGRAALLATLLCFVLNLLWVLVIRIEPFSDYLQYWQVACSLAAGTEIPTAWYVAMYPHILGTASFLSVFIRLFGESVLAVTVVNVLLSCLSCLLVYALTDELADSDSAFLAALLWAVCPCKLMLNSLVFSEPLYTCLILLFLHVFLRIDRRFSGGCGLPAALGLGALSGLLLLLINIVRPIALILVIALVLWLLFLRGGFRDWKPWLCCLASLLLVYSLGGKLWDRHVEERLGMEPASIPIYNVYVGFNEATQGQWSAEDMDLLFSYLSEEGVTTSEAQRRMIPHLKERLASVTDYPRLFASKLIAFLGNDELGGYTYRFTREPLFVKLCMGICNVFYYGVFLAALRALWLCFRSRRLSADLVLPLFFLGLTLAHMLVEVSVRYHYSLIPILIIFAAVGLSRPGKERSTS